MKNTLVMIVVGVISVVCAFAFVAKFHSSKGVYDITKSADASTSESSSDGAESDPEDGNDVGTEKDVKSKKKKSKSKSKKKDKKGNDGNNEKSNSVLGKILVPMDSIVVNIGKVDSKRYLRVIISLEVKNSEIEETIKKNKVVFRDKLVSYLSSRNLNEVRDQANHQGLRTEIKDLLNSTLLGSDDAISQVYFSDFIIQ
ncbi:MAG: flagellar basal body-associated FliL family protein [Candidatus Scalindua sp.]